VKIRGRQNSPQGKEDLGATHKKNLTWRSQNQMSSMTFSAKKKHEFQRLATKLAGAAGQKLPAICWSQIAHKRLRFPIAAPEKSRQRREGTCAFGAINKI